MVFDNIEINGDNAMLAVLDPEVEVLRRSELIFIAIIISTEN
jgi:hypothetical protein